MDTDEKRVRNDTNNSHEVSSSSPQVRNWAHLLPDILAFILGYLSPSFPDRLAFSAVCKPWRSFSKSTTATIPTPPLILIPQNSHFRLKNPTFVSRSLPSTLSPKALSRNCVGHSHGHLIFTTDDAPFHAVIADPLTGAVIHSPRLPRRFAVSFGILTALPSSSSCALLLVCSDRPVIGLWSPTGNSCKWCMSNINRKVVSLVVFKEKIYGVCSRGTTFALEIPFLLSWKTMTVSARPPSLPGKAYRLHMVECGEELLLVVMLLNKICIYRMDFSACKWKEAESIGDWCLFMDRVSNCPFACPNPTSWGGRNNCIYVAGLISSAWSAFRLDGSDSFKASFCRHWKQCWRYYRWPHHVWVYPSMLI